jgi:hypothetical protein
MERVNWKEERDSESVMRLSSFRSVRNRSYSCWSVEDESKYPSAMRSRRGKYTSDFSSAAVSLIRVKKKGLQIGGRYLTAVLSSTGQSQKKSAAQHLWMDLRRLVKSEG